jgi:hypothetical protein
MHLCKLLIIIFCHPSLATLQLAYPEQTFELPNHPFNWMCTVHVTAVTFANYTTSDIAERFLESNREKIIPTVSTMSNRNISIAPVNSFFEPCTISVLIDATIEGSSYFSNNIQMIQYIDSNEYVYRGWRHSVVILIYFSCTASYSLKSVYLPHRLFYHSVDCGPQLIFPNQAFVPDPPYTVRNINDPAHRIHDRQLPLELRRSIPTPQYGWDRSKYNIKPYHCLASRWDELSQMMACKMDVIAVHHYQRFLNFTTVRNTLDTSYDSGKVMTNEINDHIRNSMSLHAIDSMNSRVLYCDRNSDSLRLRPIRLSSPFTFETWVMLIFLLIFCAIVSNFIIFGMCSAGNHRSTINFIKTCFSGLFELIMCLLEKDEGKKNCAKAFIGLLVICLGNTYKNYLTIELVYPRAGDAISNFTELLDLNFNILESVTVNTISNDKSTYLNITHLHLEIDDTKREKYIHEAERWLKLILNNEQYIINQLASVTDKNAWIIIAPYHIQVYNLNLITQRNFPLACHFVKRPFASKFREFYFFNPKAQEFKWLTGKFLDHGLFEFWKRLDSQMLTLYQHKNSLENRSKRFNSSSVEPPDVQNFIGQVHLIVFYIVIAILTAICVAIFLVECAMQNAQALSKFVLNKFKHLSLKLLWTISRTLLLVSRHIGRLCRNQKLF